MAYLPQIWRFQVKGCGKCNETIEGDHKEKYNDPHFEPGLCIQIGTYTGTWVNRVAFGPRFVSCALPVWKYTNTNKNTNTHMDWDMVNRVAFGRRFVSYALPERKRPLKIRVGCILVKRIKFQPGLWGFFLGRKVGGVCVPTRLLMLIHMQPKIQIQIQIQIQMSSPIPLHKVHPNHQKYKCPEKTFFCCFAMDRQLLHAFRMGLTLPPSSDWKTNETDFLAMEKASLHLQLQIPSFCVSFLKCWLRSSW